MARVDAIFEVQTHECILSARMPRATTHTSCGASSVASNDTVRIYIIDVNRQKGAYPFRDSESCCQRLDRHNECIAVTFGRFGRHPSQELPVGGVYVEAGCRRDAFGFGDQ